MNKKLLLLFLAVITLAACGGEEETVVEDLDSQRLTVVNQEEFPPEEFTTIQSYADTRADMLRVLSDEGTIPPKPIDVSGRDYIDMLVEDQIRDAYSGEGEYIDPIMVREMLHNQSGDNGAATEQVAPRQQEVVKTWRISYEVHDKALEKFKAGDMQGAAGLWKDVSALSRAFTISIEIDCDTTKLRDSYQAVQNLEMPIFVIAQNIKGKSCFRLCAGIFEAPEEAAEYIEKIKEQLPGTYPFAMSYLRN